MKLMDVPAGAMIIVPELNNQELYKYYNNGLETTYCQDKDGKIVNIPQWTEVEIVKGR